MKKILISDDSITVRKVIEMLLRPLNFDLLFAETGKDTLSKVMSEKVDLAIIDYSLPDVVGTQIAKEIKKINPLVPILLMISSKEQELANKLQEAMSDDLIEKPFDSQTFLNKIDVLLKKSFEETPPSKPVQEELTVDINLDNIGIEFEKEYVRSTGVKETKIDEKSDLTIHELEKNVQEEGLELIDEIEEIEEVGEEVLPDIKEEEVEKVEEISIDDLLKEDIETLSIEDNIDKGLEISDLTIEEEKREENIVKEEKAYLQEEKSINLEDFFADLNDILKEEKVENKAVPEKEMVKPVIEEVAKELKEIEMITEKAEESVESKINEIEEKGVEKFSEEDIWNFDLDLTQKPLSVKESIEKPKLESKEIEDIVREITYDIVEKIAWEIVPEIVDTIMKDKFSKKS